ncbi:hypothetical protein FB446DRAFT_357239 [Lentinula raphanica]|nr:hypothetical protein FB446DRAFT_357239 [Lentinula raphanica]
MLNDDNLYSYNYQSPSSSDSSYSSTQSAFQSYPMFPATTRDCLGSVWAPHYQHVLEQREFDSHQDRPDDHPSHQPQTMSDWEGGTPIYSFPRQDDALVQYQDCHSLPLHAPIPLPGPPPILFSNIDSENINDSVQAPHASQPFSSRACLSTVITPEATEVQVDQSPIIDSPVSAPPQMESFMNTFSVKPPAQATFPTPCELLNELGIGNDSNNGVSPGSLSDSSSTPETSGSSATASSSKPNTKVSNLRPPEPETITSHEKKRQYLECLEQYVLYLHEQLRLVGAQPVPIERFSTYRGLSSRSIRTMLVHMENSTAKLNAKTQTEEQRFLALREAYIRQEGGSLSDPYAAASVETGEYYSDYAHFHTRPNLNVAASDSRMTTHSSNAFDSPISPTEPQHMLQPFGQDSTPSIP